MPLKQAIDKFYYQMTLNELRRMNQSQFLPNLSYNSLLYLDLIEMTPECTPSRLAEILHVSKSAVTIKVGELIRQGLVSKRQSEQDKRVFYLEIDPQAVKEYRTYDVPLRKAMEVVAERFTPDEVETFCSILATFCQAYTEEGYHA